MVAVITPRLILGKAEKIFQILYVEVITALCPLQDPYTDLARKGHPLRNQAYFWAEEGKEMLGCRERQGAW